MLGFGLLGLMLYRVLCSKWRQDSRFAQRMTAAVLVFACAFTMVHIGIGKFGQWYTDSDLVEQDTNALLLKNDLPEGDYRIDTYKIHDNIGMWLDKSCLQYFGSTAAPSILSFYPALGVKRDVRSEPEIANYALRGLLSALRTKQMRAGPTLPMWTATRCTTTTTMCPWALPTTTM